MVELLYQIRDKWQIGIIDLYHDLNMDDLYEGVYRLYMTDKIHPSLCGYRDWWTPFIAKKLEDDVCPNCGFYAGHESLGEEYVGSTTTTTHGYRDEFDHSSRSGSVVTNYYNRIRTTKVTHRDYYSEDRCCARCGYDYEVLKTRVWKE